MATQLLAERLFKEQQEAMRSKDRFLLTMIRMLRAEMQNGAIAKKAPLNSEEEIAILTREVKRRQESLNDYERADRPELLAVLQQEIALLRKYLPEQLSEPELAQMVSEAVAETDAQTMQDIGKVMGFLMPRVKGKADGNVVRQMVEKILR
ncbi:MAG TPA: GatB/YqeY domain-containing protein [Candidatus Limnocylindrales bacterium]|nr:GatB/YqeY domain-containing protein [Candidatus Limnocylindrales bacterium]